MLGPDPHMLKFQEVSGLRAPEPSLSWVGWVQRVSPGYVGAAGLTRADGGKIQLAVSPSVSGPSGEGRVSYLAMLS